MNGTTDQSWNQRKYETSNRLYRLLLTRFQRRLCALLAPLKFDTVLDVGCGEGYLARVLLDRFPSVQLVGVDVSSRAVEAARRLCPEAEFHCARVDDFDSPKTNFDLVVCSEVLEHLEEPAAALRRIDALAGRHVLLTVPREPLFCAANFLRGKHLSRLGNHPEHIHLWSKGGFIRFASEVFDVARCDTSFPWTILLGRTRRHVH